jgi:hypothetical protein
MKHLLSRLDAEHVENAKVVFEYQEVIDQLLDKKAAEAQKAAVALKAVAAKTAADAKR